MRSLRRRPVRAGAGKEPARSAPSATTTWRSAPASAWPPSSTRAKSRRSARSWARWTRCISRTRRSTPTASRPRRRPPANATRWSRCRASCKGRDICASAFEFRFMGGSMGSVVGERFTLAAERALEIGCPMVCFSATGGARMQESLFSLMQMAKTSAAIGRLREAGLPFISVLTHPTTGGVSASLGDAGRPQRRRTGSPDRFRRAARDRTDRARDPAGRLPALANSCVEHGAVDLIVDRREMRDRLARPAGPDDEAARARRDRRIDAWRRASTSAPTASAAGSARARSRPISCCASAGRPARVLGARPTSAPWSSSARTRAFPATCSKSALEAGLVAAGADVQLLGPMPTPGGRAPDALAARRCRHRDLRLAQSARRQRHQVLLGRTARSSTMRSSWRSRPSSRSRSRTVASERLGKAMRVRDALDPLRRILQDQRRRELRRCAA